ncbi:serine acetyltransferase [Nakamurella sp.]|uniref:serine acetyltransferase n=1 Tax=Nakamurella sp. TaxID=1869182 RepID=UPI003B3A8C74
MTDSLTAPADHATPAPAAGPLTGPAAVSGPTRPDPTDLDAGFVRYLFQDWAVNARRPDSRLVLLIFRLSQWAARHWGRPGRLVVLALQVLNSLLFGVELPAVCVIGPRLRLFHPHSIVLNPGVRLGADVQLRHNTTLGNIVDRDGTERGNPVIGDGVDLGATCAVLGPIVIGHGARVGALAMVTKDVPDWGIAVGNPARVIRVDEPPA